MGFSELDELGFVRVQNLVDQTELSEFEDTMSRAAAAGLENKCQTPNSEEPMSVLLKAGGENRIRLFGSLKNLDVVQRMGRSVADRLREERFFDWAKLSVPMVYPLLRADPPGEMKYLLPFHQDYATPCYRAWRVWVPLRDANAHSGTMKVVPGTHKKGFIEHDTTDPSHPSVPKADFGDAAPEIVELPAGDGLIIDPLLVHASVPATRRRMKYVLLVQLQDLATLADFDDPEDSIRCRIEMSRTRDALRG